MRDGDYTVKQFDNIVRLKHCERWSKGWCIVSWADFPFWCFENFQGIFKCPSITPYDMVYFIGARN